MAQKIDTTTPGAPGGLRCPSCGSLDTVVIDTRTRNENRLIRRRRKCQDCDHRFTTYELDADALRTLQRLHKSAGAILLRATEEIAALTQQALGAHPLGAPSAGEEDTH